MNGCSRWPLFSAGNLQVAVEREHFVLLITPLLRLTSHRNVLLAYGKQVAAWTLAALLSILFLETLRQRFNLCTVVSS